MTLYPEVQAKAHEELDRVIGRDRPPSLNDIDDLPYISAIALEALRWNPPSSNGKVALVITLAISDIHWRF